MYLSDKYTKKIDSESNLPENQDIIYVINNGTIVESGNYKFLRNKRDSYMLSKICGEYLCEFSSALSKLLILFDTSKNMP